MAHLPDILLAQAALPAQIEGQQPSLPKVSSVLTSIASALPRGPNLPLAVLNPPTLPAGPAPAATMSTLAPPSPQAAKNLGIGARGAL